MFFEGVQEVFEESTEDESPGKCEEVESVKDDNDDDSANEKMEVESGLKWLF